MGDAAYTFLPWVRTGLSTLLAARDNAATLPARASLPVSLAVNTKPAGGVTVGVFGPGDVASLDPKQVIRSEPAPGSRDFEPNYFPCVEFARADLPWMFTPSAATAADGTLRPWLVLIVVRVQEGVVFTRHDDRLSTLAIGSPAVPGAELPDLAESWAWAHAQITGTVSTPDEITRIVQSDPARVIARLLCPRRLDAGTRYRACLVPAFAEGVKAGLNQDLTAADLAVLEPAWKSADAAPLSIVLPVYYSWTFSTGADGDFESLVRALQHQELPAAVGVGSLDVGHAGGGLPEQASAIASTPGVLVSPAAVADTWKPDPAFSTALLRTLNASRDAGADPDPVVAPPIYGRWHAGVDQVAAGAQPVWLTDLNLDPRWRAFAGLGARVVRDQQNELMAAAWEQIGEVKAANALLRRSQLAREVGQRLRTKHYDKMSAATRVQFTRGAHKRLGESGATVFGTLASSSMPRGAVSGAMRKVARRGGAATLRSPQRTTARSAAALDRIVAKIDLGAGLRAVPGLTVMSDVTGHSSDQTFAIDASKVLTLSADRFSTTLAETLQRPSVTSVAAGTKFTPAALPSAKPVVLTGAAASAAAKAFAAKPFTTAAKATLTAFADPLKKLQGTLAAFAADRRVAARPAMDMAGVAATIGRRLDSASGVLGHVRSRINAPAGSWTRPDPLDTIMAAPEFPQPMYAALQSTAPKWFCAGLDAMPDETISLLRVNGRAVEAFMVGLNHEMARELLWREYPTDQRGTYFRQFWDPSGRVPAPTTPDQIEAAKDIPRIHQWTDAGALGSHLTGAGKSADLLVLAVRGSLLRRYPDATVYAVRAGWTNGVRQPLMVAGNEQQLFPLFSGTLPPDVGFFGFPLKVRDARGSTDPTKDAGWFFVVQQQPTAPRFGLDVATTYGAQPASWAQANWGDLVTSAAALDALTHVPAAGRLANRTLGGVTWGKNAAHFATITLQQPVRILIHADALLSESWT